MKDEKSRIVPYFSQLILQTSGKGLVSPITTARHDPETGFEEMPGDVPEPDSRSFRLIQIDEYRVSQAIAG